MSDREPINAEEAHQATVLAALLAADQQPLTLKDIHTMGGAWSIGDAQYALDCLRLKWIVSEARYRGSRPSEFSIIPAVRRGLQLARKFPELIA